MVDWLRYQAGEFKGMREKYVKHAVKPALERLNNYGVRVDYCGFIGLLFSL